jgi:PKD repeat protein
VVATVFASGSTTTDSVTLGDLQGNAARCPQYARSSMEEYGLNGSTTVGLPPSGPQTGTWGLGTVLGCLKTPIPLAAVKSVIVIGGNGAPEAGPNSQLTPADLRAPSDFNNSAEVPVIEDNGSVSSYDRPWREGSDLNYLDEVHESQTPISIAVFEGPRLTVSVSASPTTVAAGGTVDFTANVSPANQPGLKYSWNFDGGAADSTAASPQVNFGSGGQYTVSVQVTDAAGGGGGATIPITVTSSSSTPPAANPNGPKTGPTHSNGNTPGGRQGNQTPHGGSSGAGGNATGDSSQTAPTGSGPGNAAGQPANPQSAASRGGSAHHQAQRTRSVTHGSKPVNGPKPAAPSTNPLAVPVNGLLISDVSPVAPGASPLVHVVQASPATAPDLRTPTGTSPWPIVGAGVAVLLLLGLGAGRELRGRLGWRPLGFGG